MAKPNTSLAGHALWYEGAAFNDRGHLTGHLLGRIHTAGPGRGKCECDALSPELASGGARRRWHAEHKAEMAAGAAEGGA